MHNDPLGMFSASTDLQEDHLLSYLWKEYEKHLEGMLGEKAAQGQVVRTLEEALKKAPALHFLEWAKDFLQEFPATQHYTSAGNVGVRLANGIHVLISPAEAVVPGSMQPSISVPVLKPKDL